MNKNKATTAADGKRTERLARLKELHLRRVSIRNSLDFNLISILIE